MGKQTTVETRNLVVKLASEGKSLREIGRIIGRCHNTIKKILDKYKKVKNVEDFPRSGRPKILSAVEKRTIARRVKANPWESAVKIAEERTVTSGESVSASTVRRALHEHGLYGRVPRKKPLISVKNQKKRLEYAKKHKNEDNSFWEKCLFTDECKIEIFGRKKSQKIWRGKNKEYDENNVTKTVKHGGGSVMVWGCMAASGVGNLVFIDSTINSIDYLNILKANLQESVDKLCLGSSWVFQQDNDPKHTARIVKEWLLYRTPKQLDHPPQSPDLNPIEHLWEHLDRQIRKRPINNKESLKSAIIEEWNNISAEITKNLVHSMPRRLAAVIKAKGKQTKY